MQVRTVGRPRSGLSASDSLDGVMRWVGGILSGRPINAAMDGTLPAAAADGFVIFPKRSRPHLLVPLGSRRAARRSVRQYTNVTSVTQRLARESIGVGMRLGVAQRLLPRASLTEPGTALSSQVPLTTYLREVFGRGDIELALNLGPVRANRKPVIQVIAGTGELLGYAKIGWNALTRALVRHEAGIMTQLWANGAPETFDIPRIIRAGPWEDLELLIVAPAGPTRWYRSYRHTHPPVSPTRSLARLFDGDQSPLADSAFWRRTKQRIEQVQANGGYLVRMLLAVASRLQERHGKTELDAGGWHGDWVPWNMRYAGDRLVVWDWERAGRLAPLGLDALHFDFQVGLWVRRKAPHAALRDTLRRSPRLLGLVGVPAGRERLLLSLYLLEVCLRHEEGRAAGIDSPAELYTMLPQLFAVVD